MKMTTDDSQMGEQFLERPAAGQAKRLTTAELSGIRRRLMLKRDADGHGPTLEVREACRELRDKWREVLRIEQRTYLLDVAALLEDRQRLLEELAAHHRIGTAAELLFHESRVSEQARLVEALRRALAVAGYDTRPQLTDAGTDVPTT